MSLLEHMKSEWEKEERDFWDEEPYETVQSALDGVYREEIYHLDVVKHPDFPDEYVGVVSSFNETYQSAEFEEYVPIVKIDFIPKEQCETKSS